MDELVRVALVVNTNHSKFVMNLMNIVVYILEESKEGLSLAQIRQYAEEKLYLTFTEAEIRDAVKEGKKSQYIFEMSKDVYVLGEKACDIIGANNDKKFLQVVSHYIEVYDISEYPGDKIQDLLYRFIYEALNSNVETIMGLLKRQYNSESFEKKDADYSDEEKRIINNFLEWDNDEKNEILFKIISFSVDYCRMTVKQSTASFSAFFNGKVFFLDANIFYRLLGLNNEERERTVTQFIKKCKEMGIRLKYSNYTKNEVFDSLDYNINKLKGVMKGITASPQKVQALMSYDMNSGLYQTYHKWALECNGFGQFEDFIEYLKNMFYSLTNKYEIKQVQFENAEEFSGDVFSEKCNELALLKGIDESKNRKITIQIDAQNIFNVRKIRGKNKTGNAWDINHFLISADHNLIKWSEQEFSSEIPLAVLPSVWYSIMLKLGGRTDDDYRAYIQFMKIRYSQMSGSNISSVLYNISTITDNRVLQDRIIDNLISENNCEVELLQEDEEIQKAVNKAYDNVLEETKKKSYLAGVEEGKNIGFEEGKNSGYKKGIELAKLENQLDNINKEICKKSKRRLVRNITIRVLPIVIVVVFLILQSKFKIISLDILNEVAIYITILGWILPITIATLVSVLLNKFLPCDLKTIEEKVRVKYKVVIAEIREKMDAI